MPIVDQSPISATGKAARFRILQIISRFARWSSQKSFLLTMISYLLVISRKTFASSPQNTQRNPNKTEYLLSLRYG